MLTGECPVPRMGSFTTAYLLIQPPVKSDTLPPTYLSFSRNTYILWEDVTPAASHFSLLQDLLFNLGGITEVDAVGQADIIGTGGIEAARVHP